jgi:hypothetical protein
MKWKDEYAKSIAVGPYHTDDPRARPVFHHVHPYVPGQAHCGTYIKLDMSTLRSDAPSDGSYCRKCNARQSNWKDIPAADGEQAPKQEG